LALPFVPPVNLAEPGKARVNRSVRALSTGNGPVRSRTGIGQFGCLVCSDREHYFSVAKMGGNQIKSVWLRQTIFVPVFFALLLAPAWSLNYWQA